jgi:Fe-S cluster biogenesis protein NfuA
LSFLDRVLGRGGAREPARGDPERVRAVQSVLDELAPAVAADGGRIELVEVGDDGWVRVRMQGSCTHCNVRDTTLQGALEPRLRAAFGWVRGVREA